MMSRPGGFDPSFVPIHDLSKVAIMLFDVYQEEDEAHTVTGVVMVEDFKNISISHLAAMTPVTIKKAMTLFQVFCLAFSPRGHSALVERVINLDN